MRLGKYEIEKAIEANNNEILEKRDRIYLINCQRWTNNDTVRELVEKLKDEVNCPTGYELTAFRAIICLEKQED